MQTDAATYGQVVLEHWEQLPEDNRAGVDKIRWVADQTCALKSFLPQCKRYGLSVGDSEFVPAILLRVLPRHAPIPDADCEYTDKGIRKSLEAILKQYNFTVAFLHRCDEMQVSVKGWAYDPAVLEAVLGKESQRGTLEIQKLPRKSLESIKGKHDQEAERLLKLRRSLINLSGKYPVKVSVSSGEIDDLILDSVLEEEELTLDEWHLEQRGNDAPQENAKRTIEHLLFRHDLIRWIDLCRKSDRFYQEIVRRVAKQEKVHISESRMCERPVAEDESDGESPADLEPKEADCLALAHDFLLHLRLSNKRQIQSWKGIERELRGFIPAQRDPESYDAWDILSETIRKLAKARKVRRLDTIDEDEDNRNLAIWICRNGDDTRDTANSEELLELCAKGKFLGRLNLEPQKRKNQRSISPANAKEFILKLLEFADGPVLFEAIHAVALQHLPLMRKPLLLEAPRGDDEEEAATVEKPSAGYSPDVLYWALDLNEQASELAERVWKQLDARHRTVLCEYTLPKHFGDKVAFQDLGKTATISGWNDRVIKVLDEVMGPSLPDWGNLHERLRTKTYEKLEADFCGASAKETE